MVPAIDAIFRKAFSIHDPNFSFSYFVASVFIFYFLSYPEFNLAYGRRKELELSSAKKKMGKLYLPCQVTMGIR